jgi:hypothetical protein
VEHPEPHVQNVFEWFSARQDARPWLILGKGPSFEHRNRFDLTAFSLLGLNHVCREQPVDLAHIIDLDVITDLGDSLEQRAAHVVMPWIPHVKNEGAALARVVKGPTVLSDRTLDVLAREHAVLRRLDEEGRLLWYNLSTARAPHDETPVVRVQFFSAEAALNMLGLAGERMVRSLGVDGGASYSTNFADLNDKTLLANRRRSFDAQFAGIATTIRETGMDYAPLDMESPVRVYVATTDAQMLSVKVLEWSIRKHASLTVEVYPMHLSGVEIPVPRAPANRPRTPFSFQRFLIPALAGYRGRAIYLDSDMQVFRDIRELWTLPFGDADLLAAREPGGTGRKPQFSVMLLNCERLRWDITGIVGALDRGALTYEQLMYGMRVAEHVSADIDPEWNSLERYEEGRTSLVHFTDMNTQPWVALDNPINFLWARDLFEALRAGFITRDFVAEHVAKGYVRPSLLHQIDHGIEDSLLLPKAARSLDQQFRAPYMEIAKHGATAWRSPRRALQALGRQVYQKSALARVARRVKSRFSM